MNNIPMLLALLTIMTLTLRPQLPDLALAYVRDLMTPKEPEEPEWRTLVMFSGGSSSSAPSPDPQIGRAAIMQAQTGQDYLDFAREQFGVANDRQAEQDRIANQVTRQQMAASQQASDWAKEDRARYNEVFKPLQDDFIDKAKNWDSPERQAKMAAEAKADVLNNAAQEQQASERRMAAMGVDPTSGRYAGVDRSGDLATTLAAAGAENTARDNVRKEAIAMQGDAINLGSGLAVNPASSLGLGVSAGSAAAGTTAANNAQRTGNASIMGAGFQSAMQGYGQQANILQNQYNSQLNAWSQQNASNAANASGTMGAVGSIAGMAMVAF